MAGYSGKRGGAVCISTPTTAPTCSAQDDKDIRVAEATIYTVSHVISTNSESSIVDLYAVGANNETKPFIHQIQLHGPKDESIQIWALFDNGAMKDALSTAAFERTNKLGKLLPSTLLLRMADGSIVKSRGKWEGVIEVKGVKVQGSVEIFDSGGNWDFLFGKTLLKAFKSVHDYETDQITLNSDNGSVVLENQAQRMKDQQPEDEPTTPICIITEGEQNESSEDQVVEINMEKPENKSLFTRQTDPFKPERVEEILGLITIGTDLTDKERNEVRDLIREFADIFALSVHEVLPVNDAIHRLNISPDATFSKKVHQKPLTPPQRQYLYESIDVMLEAGIIEPCTPENVKCVSPTTLAQKAHQGKGLTLEELQHRVNDECIAHGMEPRFDLPPRTAPTPDDRENTDKPKWRICQNFSQINKVTQVAPMPQGDIQYKFSYCRSF